MASRPQIEKWAINNMSVVTGDGPWRIYKATRESTEVRREYEKRGKVVVASGDRRSASAATRGQRSGPRRERARSGSPRSGRRAKRGENKAAVFGVIADRAGVTVTEIAHVTGIAKPLIYNTTRAGVERGELKRVALPAGQHGFPIAQATPAASHRPASQA